MDEIQPIPMPNGVGDDVRTILKLLDEQIVEGSPAFPDAPPHSGHDDYMLRALLPRRSPPTTRP